MANTNKIMGELEMADLRNRKLDVSSHTLPVVCGQGGTIDKEIN